MKFTLKVWHRDYCSLTTWRDFYKGFYEYAIKNGMEPAMSLVDEDMTKIIMAYKLMMAENNPKKQSKILDSIQEAL